MGGVTWAALHYATKDVDTDKMKNFYNNRTILNKRLQLLEEALGIQRDGQKPDDAIKNDSKEDASFASSKHQATIATSNTTLGRRFDAEITAVRQARQAGAADPLSVLKAPKVEAGGDASATATVTPSPSTPLLARVDATAPSLSEAPPTHVLTEMQQRIDKLERVLSVALDRRKVVSPALDLGGGEFLASSSSLSGGVGAFQVEVSDEAQLDQPAGHGMPATSGQRHDQAAQPQFASARPPADIGD